MKFLKKVVFFILPAILPVLGLIFCSGKLSADNYFPVIVSPYSNVDWQNFGQYKAALHVHTTNSDGAIALSKMIEDHYQKNYDILAITDHNFLTACWVNTEGGLTQERFNEIAAGEDRGGRGLLQIPYTNEQSLNEHVNTFFANHNNPAKSTLKDAIRKAEDLNGLSHINHPARYTGGKRRVAGANAANNRHTVQKYVDLFMAFPSCVGMEIINKKDEESASDRILWDNILMRTSAAGRYVWGFSNDDTHSIESTGFSFNVFVMPENNLENVRGAMLSGSFYAVARVSKRELGNNFTGEGPVPVIVSIDVDDVNGSISITAENSNKIEWISNGKVVARGNTIKIGAHRNRVGFYVRANISGPGGIAFTQPFGIFWCQRRDDASSRLDFLQN
jgi:hypothetical protein